MFNPPTENNSPFIIIPGKDISLEIACLIRESLSAKELKAMGLWGIIVMHEPIKDSVGHPFLLSACHDLSGQWLDAYCDNPDDRWDRDDGFAFVVPQVVPEH